MVLVDTCVWVEHLNRTVNDLASLLGAEQVLTHPWVIGEIACGNLRDRRLVLHLLAKLPQAALANDDEVLQLIEEKKLAGSGVGWVDAHLLASALIEHCLFWTTDERLRMQAVKLGISY